MIKCLLPRKQSPSKLVWITFLFVWYCNSSFAQNATPVTGYECDKRVNQNDNPCAGIVPGSSCDFLPTEEKGCRCFDGADNDGDGKKDAADPNCATYFGLSFVGDGSNCSITPPGANTPFDFVGDPVVSGQNTADTQSKVAVGNVDNDADGKPDMVITSKWNSEVRLVASTTAVGNPVVEGGASFDPGDVMADYNADGNKGDFPNCDGEAPKNLLFEHEVLIADINGDKISEIFAIVSNRSGSPSSPPVSFYLLALKLDDYGPSGLKPMYQAVCLGKNRPGIFGIADMDGEKTGGKRTAEVYIRDRIFAAETGKLLASPSSKLMTGTGTADWDVSVPAASVAVDIVTGAIAADGSKLELVVGPKIYKIPNLSANRSPASPGALTQVADMNTIAPGWDITGEGTADQYFVKLNNDPTEYGIDTHSSTSVADIDKDGSVDVVLTGAVNSASGRTAIFYWNVKDNKVTGMLTPSSTELGYTAAHPDYTNYQNGWIWGTGRVNLGDANGDGVIDLSFIAGNQLFCVKADMTTNRLSSVWTQNQLKLPSTSGTVASAGATFFGYRLINDSRSGILTVTIYDFDNDGQPEMVYRDSQELNVIDGPTGTVVEMTKICRSHTYTEGPIIADVNGDGDTDIACACNRNDGAFDITKGINSQNLGEVRLWYSSGEWLPTRSVWNQPGYFVVNINDDLTLPFPQFDIATKFLDGPCFPGQVGDNMPYNVFLNQVPFLSSTGCPVFPAPDLGFIGEPPGSPVLDPNDLSYDPTKFPTVFVESPICGNLDIKVGFNIENTGDLPITASIPVSFFAGDPYNTVTPGTLLHSTTINVNNLQVGDKFSIGEYNGVPGDVPFIAFNGPGTTFQLYVVLYNDGSVVPIPVGTPEPDGQVPSNEECDITNNSYAITVTPRPFTVNIDSLDNVKCNALSPDKGELTSHISVGADTVIDLSPYGFQWYMADQTTEVGTAFPGVADNNYNVIGLPAGDYYLVITNNQKGCASDPILGQIVDGGLLIPDAEVKTVSDQTQCNPLNGALQVIVAGGNAGFEFSWEDSSGPIGVTGATLSGVEDGTYTVTITETASGCQVFKDGVVGKTVPEPTVTLTANDVVNCVNANTGSVSATAFFSAVAQDSVNYRFDWYTYNEATATRGSILPANTGNPTIKGLPIGFYEVEVTHIASGCPQLDPEGDTIEIKDVTILPEARLTRIRPQTSCDPTLPNGALQADAYINGVLQPAANFKFEWFIGQNTITPYTGLTSQVQGLGTQRQRAEELAGGGQAYTVRITTANQCSVTADSSVAEIINYPQAFLSTAPNSICDPGLAASPRTGAVQVDSVLFGGVKVADFTNYSFTWYDGSVAGGAPRAETGQQLAQLDSGFYTLVVENTALHCPSIANVEQVLSTKLLPVIVADADSSTNCRPAVLGNGRVKLTKLDNVNIGSVNLANYNFTWHRGVDDSGPAIGLVDVAMVDTLQGRSPNNFFTIAVLNNLSGCENTATVEVVDAHVLPLVTLAPTDNTICDNILAGRDFDGTVTGTVTNAAPGGTYTYAWTDLTPEVGDPAITVTSNFIDERDSSTYRAVVTHVQTGCVSNPVTAFVDELTALPIITVDGDSSTNCRPAVLGNGRVRLTAIDGAAANATTYDYTWHRGTDETGVAIGALDVAMVDTLQGRSPNNFFTVHVINKTDGCQDIKSVEVVDAHVLPLVTLAPTDNTICDNILAGRDFDGTVTGTVTNAAPGGTYTYAWTDLTPEVGDPAITVTSNFIDERDSSTYRAVVTHVQTGCVSNPVTAFVDELTALPIITVDGDSSTNCRPAVLGNGRVRLTAIDGAAANATTYDYTWHRGTDETGVAIGALDVAMVDTLQGRSPNNFFTVHVINKTDGCQDIKSVEVVDAHVLPLVTLAPTDNTICDAVLAGKTFDGTVTGDVSNAAPGGTYTYAWTDLTPEVGDPAITVTSNFIDERDSSTYRAVVTHVQTGCVSNPVTAFVDETTTLPFIEAEGIPSTNCDPAFANGQAVVTMVDGIAQPTATYTFAWYRGVDEFGIDIGIDPTNAAASIDTLQGRSPNNFYTVLVTNTDDGCQNTKIVEVLPDQELPEITLSSVDNTNCAGTPNGKAFLTTLTDRGVNITKPYPAHYTFAWEGNASTTDTLFNRSEGNYSLKVKNTLNGCESDSVSVDVDETLVNPIILLATTPQTSCDPLDLNGQIDASVDLGGGSSTTNGYKFRWFQDQDTSALLPAANVHLTDKFSAIDLPGNVFYTAKVTNSKTLCESTRSIFLREIISIPRVELVATPIVDCSIPGYVTATLFADLDGNGTEEAVPAAQYADYVFTWYNGNSTSAPQLVNTVDSVLRFLDDGVTTIPAAYYTTEVENSVTHCASSDITDLLSGPGPLFDIDISLNAPLPASCSGNSGVMTAFINDGMGGTTTGYTFEWYTGTITNGIQTPPASFYTNPPVGFNGSPLDVDAGGIYNDISNVPPYLAPPPPVPGYQAPDFIPGPSFTGPTLYGINSGNYTVVATRNSDGCKEYLTYYLGYQTEPVIILAEITPDECSADVGAVSVDITVPGGTAPSDYKIWLIDGTNPTLTPAAVPIPAARSLIDPAAATNNNFTGLPSGTYTVVAQEDPLNIATGCFSQPVLIELREALPPTLDITATAYNTSCGGAPGTGSLEITFGSDPSDPFNPGFPPPPPPTIYNPSVQTYGITVLDGLGNTVFSNPVPAYASGAIETIPDLLNGDFEVTITSSHGCSITKTYTVPWHPNVGEIGSDTLKQDALFCTPALETNARIEVQSISIVGGAPEDLSDYLFEWYTDITLSAASKVMMFQGNSTIAKGGEILSNTGGAPTPSPPVTAGSYWVVATKNSDVANGTGGVGCFTAPMRIDILDKSKNPSGVLTTYSNTACTNNAAFFEGSGAVHVTDATLVTGPFTYTYNWDESTNPTDIESQLGSPATGVVGNSGNGLNDGMGPDADSVTNLGDGVYALTITNQQTGCVGPAQGTVLKTTVPVIISDVSALNKFFCYPSGQARVDTVLVAGNLEPNTNFTFTWTEVDQVTTIPVAGTDSQIDSANVATIAAGSYYVSVQKILAAGSPGAGCTSAPAKVDILDKTKDPVPVIFPYANTACTTNAAFFEGSAAVHVSDASSVAGPFTYTYNWDEGSNPTDIETQLGSPATGVVGNSGNGLNDGMGPDADSVTNLGDGVYRLVVTNTVTGCSKPEQTTILKSTVPVIISKVSALNKFFCYPSGQARVDTVLVGGVLEPITNFTFSWFESDQTTSVLAPMNALAQIDSANVASIAATSYYVTVQKDLAAGSPGAGCVSPPAKVDILDKTDDPIPTLVPYANTACTTNAAFFEGSIAVHVADASSVAGPFTYTYNWDEGSNPTDIETQLGSPATGVVGNSGNGLNDGMGPDADSVTNLGDGVYRLVVTNTVTGCSKPEQTTILKSTVPVIISKVSALNKFFCYPSGQARVDTVLVGGVLEPITNFTFSWFESDQTTSVLAPMNALAQIDSANVASIAATSYYVTVQKDLAAGSPGAGCVSPPAKVDILDKTDDPIPTLVPYANTACTTNAAFFEGSIAVHVADASSVAGPFTYTYNWDEVVNPTDIETQLGYPTLTGVTGNNGNGLNDGVGPDADSVVNLSDGIFRLVVTNTVTGCSKPEQTTILKTTIPVIISKVSALDRFFCLPSGHARVDTVLVGGLLEPNANFAFSWFESDQVTPIAVPGNTVQIDSANLASITPTSYYVSVTKLLAAGSPAAGCTSAPAKIDIVDRHVNPIPQTFTFANSTCTAAFLNGAVKIIVTETGGPGVGQPYDYENFTDGVMAPTDFLTNNGDGDNLGDNDSIPGLAQGTYSFIVRNQITQCFTPAAATIDYDPIASKPNVIDVDTNLPFDCLGSGGDATVTAITIGDQAPITGSPALDPPNFEYDWFDNSADASDPANLPGNVPVGAPSNLRAIAPLPAGTYYVKVRDLLTDCISTPIQFIIDDVNVDKPVLEITQTALQLNCMSPVTTTGTGALAALADGQDDSNLDYSFTWFQDLDATVPYTGPGANTDNIANLLAGDYSVSVTRASTGCTSSMFFIVPDLDPQFKPAMALSGDEQSSCIVDNGSVVVRVLPFQDHSSGLTYEDVFATYDFEVDLYYGNQLGAGLENPDGTLVPAPDKDNIPALAGAPDPGSFISDTLTNMIYTIRLRDRNTGCVLVDTTSVAFAEVEPVPDPNLDNPLTNCDTRFNGQLSVTADGRPVGEYNFFWWDVDSPPADKHNPPVGPPVLSINDKLIGVDRGFYEVLVVNKASGCDTLISIEVPNGQPIIFTPTIELLLPQTMCWENVYPLEPQARPNGAVEANVNDDVLGYRFDWYTGSFGHDNLPASPDTTGIIFMHLKGQTATEPGVYTVSAVDVVTSCWATQTVVVPDERIIPEGTIATTPSFCTDAGAPNGSAILTITNYLEEGEVLSLRDVDWYDVPTETSIPDELLQSPIATGTQLFGIEPGFYFAKFTSAKFCVGTAVAEVRTEIRSYNLVSSNGDNENDSWVIDCISNFTVEGGAKRDNNVKIFNRYGVLVYEVDGYNNADKIFKGIGENGLYSFGNDLPDGTYFYIIDKRNGTKPITGYLELVR